MQSDFILIENVSHEYSNELEYSIKLLMKYIEQLDGDHTTIDLDYIKSFLCSTTSKLFALKSSFYAKDYGKYDVNYNSECEHTIKELQDKLGYHKVFYDMENRVIAKAYTATFIYNGRDDVTWNELPLEVRKHDYPYYFNKDGEDCYPYRVDIYDMD